MSLSLFLFMLFILYLSFSLFPLSFSPHSLFIFFSRCTFFITFSSLYLYVSFTFHSFTLFLFLSNSVSPPYFSILLPFILFLSFTLSSSSLVSFSFLSVLLCLTLKTSLIGIIHNQNSLVSSSLLFIIHHYPFDFSRNGISWSFTHFLEIKFTKS